MTVLLTDKNKILKDTKDDGKQIIPLSEYFEEKKTKMLTRIINEECDPTITSMTLNTDILKPPKNKFKKQWKPKDQLTTEAVTLYWEKIKDNTTGIPYDEKLNLNNAEHIQIIKEHSENAL